MSKVMTNNFNSNTYVTLHELHAGRTQGIRGTKVKYLVGKLNTESCGPTEITTEDHTSGKGRYYI